MTANTSPSATDAPLAQDALWAALNELLEAERAGARVARETAQAIATSDPLHALVEDIQRDEVAAGIAQQQAHAQGGETKKQFAHRQTFE